MQPVRRPRQAAGLVLPLLVACAQVAPPASLPSPEAPRSRPAARKSPPPCKRIVHLEVHKAERSLWAHCQEGRVVKLEAAMGREPLGHKRISGDMRTPEGRYRISGPAEPSRFHAFVPIDYPSVADADAALADGRISPRDHARIVGAHARGEPPPGDTLLGGDIGLHGEGERWAGDTRDLDWTLGCVALSDADLDFLIQRLEPGVTVEIRP